MTRAELAKIFNEIDATFHETEIYKLTLGDVSKALAEGKRPREMILFDGAFELSKRFMFEVMCKALCDESANNPETLAQNRE